MMRKLDDYAEEEEVRVRVHLRDPRGEDREWWLPIEKDGGWSDFVMSEVKRVVETDNAMGVTVVLEYKSRKEMGKCLEEDKWALVDAMREWERRMRYTLRRGEAAREAVMRADERCIGGFHDD